MKIKDYVCKCDNDNFVLIRQKPATVGIYCTKCGKWYKWADKNEKNLMNLQHTDNGLSDREKLAIKAMLYAFNKYEAKRLDGAQYVNNVHEYPAGTIDFDEAYNICAAIITR